MNEMFNKIAKILIEIIRDNENITTLGNLIDFAISENSGFSFTKRQWYFIFQQISDKELILNSADGFDITQKGNSFLDGDVEIDGEIVSQQHVIDYKTVNNNQKNATSEHSTLTSKSNKVLRLNPVEFIKENFRVIAQDYNDGLLLSELLQKHTITLGELLDALIQYIRTGKKLENLEYLAVQKSINEIKKDKMDIVLDHFHNKQYSKLFQFYRDPVSSNDFKIMYLQYLNNKS